MRTSGWNLLAEVFDLHDQLLEVLEGKFEQEKIPRTFSTPEVVLSPELACVTRENDMLRSEVGNTHKEIEELKYRLTFFTEENDRLVSMTAKKDSEIKELKDEWEKEAINLTNYLAEGEQALEDASE
ncbi:hypothetical protein SUGI_0833070 [Cryptomeria japonica]|nr:hypothetical protein SUGI_0833070 [Cryptomeria japonica]